MTLDDLLNQKDLAEHYTSDEISAVIRNLQKLKAVIEKEEEERKQKEQGERERQEAHVREATSMDLPLDWSNVFQSDVRTQGVHADSISDGLILSLTNLGKVDIEYISAITGEDYKVVICALKGSIYQNPDIWGECFYKGWETADEYLSGNLMRKWEAAKEANQTYHGYFSANVEAIERVLPPSVAAKDIYITLGSPWVPSDVIDDFIMYLFGDVSKFVQFRSSNHKESFLEGCKVIHDELTGSWEIPNKSLYNYNVKAKQTYGTDSLSALYILEKTLNMKNIAVMDEVWCPSNASGTKRIVDQAETAMALEKQRELIHTFQTWVWTDSRRKRRLEEIYWNKYGCIRRRVFDGSFLAFPTLSPAVRLYPYQKDAAARIIFSPNTLLAHEVGSGKTYVMIAAGQELRRMGISKKNMYVVPNSIVGQWQDIFLTMYPDARLLCVEPKNFTPEKRENVLKRIQNEDFDGIIIAYSCFELIPLSKDYYIEELADRKEKIAELVRQRGKATSRLKRKSEALEKALAELAAAVDAMYDGLYFDELGITRLFVDEAHNFKNVPIETQTTNVLGISKTGSKKCRDMMDKVHMVQRKNGGGGVVFATGTPITNSLTDVYIMQQYLQSGELALLELQSFDSWIGMFAEKTTGFEIDVDTSRYRLATRFSRFHNLPELASLLASVADFHQVDNQSGIPKMDGYHDALIARTPELAAYLSDISDRAECVRSGAVSRSEDNMLKITTDGRKAALDLRLVDPGAAFTYQSKVARCAETAADIYFRTRQNQSAQLIFCDTSTPKASFNIYDELRERLIGLGVAQEEIAFVHSADTERKRRALFAAVRVGLIRVLIGSTFKLGLGVNIQDKLIALHHLDVPWRPADMVQREGRILRQGNKNTKVHIYRYITEGSFDAYSWQLLETKQRLITDILSGSLAERSKSDVEDTVLNYAEVKALAIGDPLIKERVETANTLARFIALQRKQTESRLQMEQELLEAPARIQAQREAILKCREDREDHLVWKESNLPAADSKNRQKERKIIRERIWEKIRHNILKPEETFLMKYQGFDVLLPANMTEEKPFVWLFKRGRYYVELGSAEVGSLIRIDHFLDNLENYLRRLELGLAKLEQRESDLKSELAKETDYADEIERYRKKLEYLDQKLGVKNE